MQPNPQENGDSLTFTEEIFDGKLPFFVQCAFPDATHLMLTILHLRSLPPDLSEGCFFSRKYALRISSSKELERKQECFNSKSSVSRNTIYKTFVSMTVESAAHDIY